jgi:AraC family transcriptional regulator
MRPVPRALWFIERHLSDPLNLNEIAEAAGVSPYHLSRAFGFSTGYPVMAYVRARRLSEAALVLSGGAPDILAVAIDYGYGSHEAFTRAFREQFGLTPETLRAEGIASHIQLTKAIRMPDTPSLTLAPPRMVDGKPLIIAGLMQRYLAYQLGGIPAQWQALRPHFGHIPAQIGGVAYGVCYDFTEAGDMNYLSGVEVSDTRDLPADFTHISIPASTYAIFEHNGHVSGIGATWMAIFDSGLSEAGLNFHGDPAFERMDSDFNGQTGFGRVEIWVPVTKL